MIGSDLALTQRMTESHDAYETVSEQSLGANFRPHHDPYNTSLQVDIPFTKLSTIFIQLLNKAKQYAWSCHADAGNQVWSEILRKTLTGSQRERSHQLLEVRRLCWA